MFKKANGEKKQSRDVENISNFEEQKPTLVDYNNVGQKQKELEMLTARSDNAELLRVFLDKEEKAAFKKLAADMGIPMYHLVRKMILQFLEESQTRQ